jgi:hypothetical protein
MAAHGKGDGWARSLEGGCLPAIISSRDVYAGVRSGAFTPRAFGDSVESPKALDLF